MGMSRGVDTIITFRVLKLLTTAWEDQAAFKHGLIDDKGKRIKSVKPKTSEQRDSYTLLHKLVFNLKRIIEILPGGKSKLARYASALFLIKEHTGLTGTKLDKEVFKYLQESGLLEEGLLEEFRPIVKLQNERTYTLVRPMIINEEVDAERGDTMIQAVGKPAGKVYGVPIFRMYNVDKNQMMHCSGHDLR
tara:strand:- start:1268 stop:1840 length:573 start_codon:yes stop_codon:yes gene_type:complete